MSPLWPILFLLIYPLRGYLGPLLNPYLFALLCLAALTFRSHLKASFQVKRAFLLATPIMILFFGVNLFESEFQEIIKRYQFYFGMLLFVVLGYNMAASYSRKRSIENIKTNLIPFYAKAALAVFLLTTVAEFTLCNYFGWTYERIYHLNMAHFILNEVTHRSLGIAGNTSVNNTLIIGATATAWACCKEKFKLYYLLPAFLAFCFSFAGTAVFSLFVLIISYGAASKRRMLIFLFILLPICLYIFLNNLNKPFLYRISFFYFQQTVGDFLVYVSNVFRQDLFHLIFGNGPLDAARSAERLNGSTSTEYAIFLTIAEIGLLGLMTWLFLLYQFYKTLKYYIRDKKYQFLASVPFIFFAATLHYSVLYNVTVQVYLGLLWGIILYYQHGTSHPPHRFFLKNSSKTDIPEAVAIT